jgi:hypothetical protein
MAYDRILVIYEPPVMCADRGHDHCKATLQLGNGTNGLEIANTGEVPPGVHVRRQNGQGDMQNLLQQSQNGEMLEIERDSSQFSTQENHRLDIQGEQRILGISEQHLQHHELEQSIWAEARWEEIVCWSHEGQEAPVGPPTWHSIQLEQH